MWFTRILIFNCFIIVPNLFAFCDGEIYGSYLDVVPRKIIRIFGHKMCKAVCKKYGETLCASYNFDRQEFTCYLNTADSSTATLVSGAYFWYGESANIPSFYAGACSGVSCISRENCVILHGNRPKCVIEECVEPPTISNGAVTPGTKGVKDVRSYTCDTGYNLVGSGNITCKHTGQWETPTFICQIADCGTPSAVANADVSAGATTYASTKTYTCHQGYDTSGTTAISCQADSTWTAVGITCTIQDCSTPSVLTNGVFSVTTTTYLSTATYSCNTGYDMINGDGQITCLAGPAWESILFSCQIQDCGQPQTIANAAASSVTATTYLGTATYTCDTGYHRTGVGNGVITCQAGPAWDTINFACTIDDCSTPSALTNGVFSVTTTTYLSTATYSCNTGYDMINGDGQITCLAGPAWESILFSCQIQDCGQPQSITNAATPSVTATTYLGTATYTCDTGYHRTGVGNGVITCQAGPAWDTINFACTIDDCGQPQTISNAATPSVTATTYLGTATYTCDTGYHRTGVGNGVITCQAGPAWDTVNFACTIDDCGQPHNLANAATPSVTATTYLGTATYTCLTGYHRTGVGNGVITCQAGPAWDTINFACTIDDCGQPQTIANAAAPSVTATTYLGTATYTCDTGYHRNGVGNGVITCQAGPAWDTINFACTIDDCSGPSLQNNANSPSYTTTTYNSVATYTCVAGYAISNGPAQITCQSGGTWGTASFSCVIQDCGTPSTITNGVRSYTTTTYLSTATYSCNTGYTLSGGSQATCQAGPTWGSIPSCPPQDCGNPPTITNGVRSYTSTTYLSTATYSCNSGYTLSGGSQVTCQNGPTWGSTPSCPPQDCGIPPTILDGSRTYTTTTYLSTVTYFCNAGYGLNGASQLTCQNGPTWGTGPTCILIQCPEPLTTAGVTVTGGTGLTPGSTRSYTCNDPGYPSGTTTLTCQSNGAWSPYSDYSCSCSSLASTYTQIPNKFFNPPVSFTPSISGSLDAAYCKSACNTRSDFVCVAMYYRKSTGGYCILRPQRVNDNPSYPQYYNDDTSYDEYIRDCNG